MRRLLSFREHHEAWVSAWMTQAARGLSPFQRLALFDRAFAALFSRAGPTLGELTLSAAFERTLREVVLKFPQLSSLKVGAAGMSFLGLRGDEHATGDVELTEALRFLLVELLTSLGSLTGEALTPLLHRELARSGSDRDAGGPESEPRGAT